MHLLYCDHEYECISCQPETSMCHLTVFSSVLDVIKSTVHPPVSQ